MNAKRLLMVLAAIVFTTSTALAEILTGGYGRFGDEVTYTLDTESGLLRFEGKGEMRDFYPDKTYPIWFYYNYSRVEISYGVTYIGDYAFYNCPTLTSVSIPSSVTSIGGSAFYGCTNLKRVYNASTLDITKGSTSNGEVAKKALVVYKGERVQEGDFVYVINSDDKKYVSEYLGRNAAVSIPQVDGIADYAFYDCSFISSVAIPKSITHVEMYAFSDCDNLTSVLITDIDAWCRIKFDSNPLTYAHNLYLNGKLVTDLTIPSSVTSIGDRAFNGCRSLKSVTIPGNLSSIGNRAFLGCTSLTSASITGSVTSIGEDAFWNCSGLTSISITGSVTSIGDRAFQNCSGLTSIDIPASVRSIGEGAFNGCEGLTSINVAEDNSAYKSIDGVLYSKNVTELVKLPDMVTGSFSIPSTVTRIANYAIFGCSGLTSLTVPRSVTSLEYHSIDCFYLESLTWGTNANPKYVTQSCKTNLKTVTLLDGISRIEEKAFANCRLTSINIPKSVTYIDDRAFYDARIESLTWDNDKLSPSLVLNDNGRYLKEVTLVDGITKIADGAFEGCTGLTSITIPNSVTSIGNYAFSDCRGLTSITIPSSVTSIGVGTFQNCRLTSITIPESVTSIGDYAFRYCDLASITILASVNNIGKEAFLDCRIDSLTWGSDKVSPLEVTSYCREYLKDVTLLDNITNIDSKVFSGCSKLTSINVTDNNPAYKSIDGVLYNKEVTEIITCPAGKTGYFAIPESVTSIEGSAFKKCSGLTSITIPNSVINIGGSAFSECSGLTSITIPNSVINIGEGAFYGCSGLTSITIPNSVINIGEAAFYYCTGLTSISVADNNPAYKSIDGVLYNKEVTEIITCPAGNTSYFAIPESVTSIGNLAFWGCSGLTSITIPNSVTSIGYDAFSGCTGLTSIIIPESVTSIGGGAFGGCTGLTSITIPESVTSIGGGAFYGCSNIESLTWGSNKASLKEVAYDCKESLKTVTILESVTDIDENPFGSCNKMKDTYIHISSIEQWLKRGLPYRGNCHLMLDGKELTFVFIPKSVTSIREGAFRDCTSLKSVLIPNSVTTIGDHAFYGCTGLTSVTIPNSVKEIADYAFDYCTGLTSVTIGNSVKSIGGRAFDGCNLTTMTCKATVPPTVSSYLAFSDKSTRYGTLYVPEESIEAYKTAFIWKSWKDIQAMPQEDEDGIEGVTPDLSPNRGAMYDLQGRRIQKPAKGLYIQNGKKMLTM